MEQPLILIELALTQAPIWLQAILSFVGAASAIAALTPTPRDDRFLGQLYKVVDLIALNIGHAKETPPNKIPRDFL